MIFQREDERVVERRKNLVGFRCTDEERKVLDDQAKNAGISLSDFMRHIVNEFLQKQEDSNETE